MNEPRGQVLVIVGVAMIGLIAMVGLIIDVGFAWAANRDTQNGSDAAAHAGAIVIVQQMAGITPARTDDDVEAAVASAATENEMTVVAAEYVDVVGNPLPTPVEVGSAAGNAIPPAAQGVRVEGRQVHDTLVAKVIGIGQLTAGAEAIAVGGPSTDPCPTNDICAFIPITFPTTIVTCDGQNKSLPTTSPWVNNTEYIIPLCGNNPGSLGWIDWYAPAGGAAELALEICDPNPPPIDLPDWFEVSSTGNVNSADVENCLNKYAGERIMMPMFDDTCREDPGEGNPCTNPAAAGGNLWYHFPSYAVFELREPKGAYVNGNNSSVCDPTGGNGATSCLIGRFIDGVAGGSVGVWDPTAPQGPSMLFAVQLIK